MCFVLFAGLYFPGISCDFSCYFSCYFVIYSILLLVIRPSKIVHCLCYLWAQAYLTSFACVICGPKHSALPCLVFSHLCLACSIAFACASLYSLTIPCSAPQFYLSPHNPTSMSHPKVIPYGASPLRG